MTDLVVRVVFDGAAVATGTAAAETKLVGLGSTAQATGEQASAAWRKLPAQLGGTGGGASAGGGDLGKSAAGAQKSLAALGQAGQISAGQTAQAWRTLPAQFTDVVTQLQGGASPLTVLIQQGGQVKDSFGGIAPMFRQLATLITPVSLAVGVGATALALFGLAAYQGAQESAALGRAVLLTGGYAGVTAGSFSGLARDVAESSRVSIGASREMTLAFVSTGQIGPQAIGAVTAAALTLAKVSGTSAKEVAGDFAGMSNGVAKWAAEHNRAYAFLTAAEWDHIRALEDQGRVEEAMVLTSSKLDAALKARQPELSALGKLWDELGKKASSAWNAMSSALGSIGRAETPEEELAKLQEKRGSRQLGKGYERMSPDIAAAKRMSDSREQALAAQILQTAEMDSYNAEAAARERQAIADKLSGKTNALANAGVDKSLAQQRNASAAQLAAIAGDQQRLDAIYKSGLLSVEVYTAERIALIKTETAAQAVKVDEEIAAEKRRPADTDVARAQQSAKLAALEGQRQAAVAEGAKRVAQAQIDGDQAVLDSARTRAQAWADAWKAAQDQVRTLQGANADKAIGLIRDPQAQDRARNDQANALLRRQQDERTRDLRTSQATEPDLERWIALQGQIQAIDSETTKGIELNNTALAEKLKPVWQRNLDAWRDTNSLMRDSWNDLMTGVQKNGEDAFVQFMTTGKLSVKSLVTDALAEMARLDYRKFMASSGGVGGLLSSAASFIGGLFGGGRATGGNAPAGSMLLVGESGPELLRMGGSSGTVVPNQSVGRVLSAGGAGSGGGGSTSISLALPTTIYMDARSDQAQVSQLVVAGMAQTEKRMWAALRTRGLVR